MLDLTCRARTTGKGATWFIIMKSSATDRTNSSGEYIYRSRIRLQSQIKQVTNPITLCLGRRYVNPVCLLGSFFSGSDLTN